MDADQRPPTVEWHGPNTWKKDKSHAKTKEIWSGLLIITISLVVGIFIGLNI